MSSKTAPVVCRRKVCPGSCCNFTISLMVYDVSSFLTTMTRSRLLISSSIAGCLRRARFFRNGLLLGSSRVSCLLIIALIFPVLSLASCFKMSSLAFGPEFCVP